ncbi:MAG: hypothetical protein AAF802_11820 [Planctomycetota bacterium]
MISGKRNSRFCKGFSRLLLGLLIAFFPSLSSACPFCSALAPTLSDDLESSAAAVIARCESSVEDENGFWVCKMRIAEVLKGKTRLADSVIEVVSLEELSRDEAFWMVGFGDEEIVWADPKQVSDEAIAYLRQLDRLPKQGSKRLKAYLEFLKHSDPFISADAYNEFAEASLADITALKDVLDREWILKQLRDKTVPVHRRRLCWTFLSQCGKASDVGVFDECLSLKESDEKFDPGMDAAISCFVSLTGEQGLERIERDYLANADADYLDSFSAIGAIRVHGTELEIIPRERLAESLKLVLERPALADLVIPDLGRWEDWSAIDRVVELFENTTEQTHFVKSSVVLYLKACPLPAADTAIEKLRSIDPKAVSAAEASLRFYPGFASVPVPPPNEDAAADDRVVKQPKRSETTDDETPVIR